MNALDHLIAGINAKHKGGTPPQRPAACPQGQASRPRPAKRQAAAKPPRTTTSPEPVAGQRSADESPIIARARAVLRAEIGRI